MSLLKSALTVSGLTLVSRVTGVIRDMLIARFFGASAETDAFYVAFRLPNMLRRLFAEGAFQQAFVPMLADVKERSEGEAGTFIDHVFTVLALSVFAASILGVVAAPLLVWAIASGLASAPEAFDLASALTRFMFPYIAFMALTALAASVLNTWKRFAVPAVTPVLLNLSFIGCTVLLAPRMAEPIWALAWAAYCSSAPSIWRFAGSGSGCVPAGFGTVWPTVTSGASSSSWCPRFSAWASHSFRFSSTRTSPPISARARSPGSTTPTA